MNLIVAHIIIKVSLKVPIMEIEKMYSVQSVGMPDGNMYVADDAAVYNNTDEAFDKVFDRSTASRTLEDIFRDVSEEYDVPLSLLKAVAQAESGFDTNAVSSCGASGIMQLMPETAKGLGVEDVFDPEQNITGGAKMLAYLLVDYGGDTTLALAAYNAGSGAVSKYGGVPPYEETRNYIKKINNILEGGLEADLSYIAVNGSSKTDAAANAPERILRGKKQQTVSVHGRDIPVRLAENGDDDIFPYEAYLRFVEIYMKLLGTTISNDDEEQQVKDKDALQISEQQTLYELERAKTGSLVRALVQNK